VPTNQPFLVASIHRTDFLFDRPRHRLRHRLEPVVAFDVHLVVAEGRRRPYSTHCILNPKLQLGVLVLMLLLLFDDATQLLPAVQQERLGDDLGRSV
jgi:hypothetical protein